MQLGVEQILKDARPDLILSGVNNGQNMAEDVTMSGTIAAAFQGMTIGIPSVALSQARADRHKTPFKTAGVLAPGILKTLLDRGWDRNKVVMNINFPNCEPGEVAGVKVARQGRRENVELFVEERTDMRQRRYYWFGFTGTPEEPAEGTDLHAVYSRQVAVTPLHLQLTDDETAEALKGAF